jgi:hypothetical protein
LTAGETLRLSWAASTYSHNVFEVQSEDAFDRCLLGSATEVAGGSAGVNTLDVDLPFPSAGTFYYVCTKMCDPLTAYCHCSSFVHKLRVVVAPGPNTRAGYTGPVAVTELAVDLAAFSASVDVDLEGDLTSLTAYQADSVRTFAADAAADVEAAAAASTAVDVAVTCLYRLDDASRLDLLTLTDTCVAPGAYTASSAPRRLSAAAPGRRLADAGLGVIMVFKEPVEDVSLDRVVISSGDVAVQAEATTVLASGSSGEKELPDFGGNVKPGPPADEDAIISSGLAAVTAGGMLLQGVF